MGFVVDFDVLEKIIDTQGLTCGKIAADTGLSRTLFTDWKKGKSKPKQDKLQKIADYLNVPVEVFLNMPETAKPYIPKNYVPILGHISAGLPLLAEEHILGYMPIETPSDGTDYFCLKVKGDSMTAARIAEGDVLVVRCQPYVENGEIAVVLVGDEDATVKRFHKDGNIVQLIPQSYNPAHHIQTYNVKQTRIKVLGKVVRNIIDFNGGLKL